MKRRAVVLVLAGAVIAVIVVVAPIVQPFATLLALKFVNQFPASGGPPVRIESADYSGSGPGALVTATTMPGVTRTFEGAGMNAARVVYRSTNGDTGAPTVVSGSVFTPQGAAPDGGWPVVAYGHATLGFEGPCAPSLVPSLLGLTTIVKTLIGTGYAVAMPDYEGLGTKGIHPYSDAHTTGLNLIDAVRALRRTFPNVSDRWAALGDSQGGGTSWSADEQAGRYAPELKLQGALAASPAADLTGLVDKAQDGTLTPEQRPVMQAVVESLARLHPDLDRDEYRRGSAAYYWNVLSDCTEAGSYRRQAAARELGARDFAPRTPEAADRLRELLRRWALPQEPLTAPLYVYYGGKDPFIDTEWTASAIKRVCDMGGVVTVEFDPNGGHNPADGLALLSWMADRFAGKPPANDC